MSMGALLWALGVDLALSQSFDYSHNSTPQNTKIALPIWTLDIDYWLLDIERGYFSIAE